MLAVLVLAHVQIVLPPTLPRTHARSCTPTRAFARPSIGVLVAGSGQSYNAEETLSTCRFGARAKRIQNKAVVNQEYARASDLTFTPHLGPAPSSRASALLSLVLLYLLPSCSVFLKIIFIRCVAPRCNVMVRACRLSVGQYKVLVSDLKSERERLLQFFQSMSVVIKEAGIDVVRIAHIPPPPPPPHTHTFTLLVVSFFAVSVCLPACLFVCLCVCVCVCVCVCLLVCLFVF
jgi:hypothetical protein